MVVTVPHMGNIHIAVKALFDALEIPCVIPETNNNQTLRTGSYFSPEEICLPFKLILGNLLQGIEAGADTVLTVASCGPCRFGEYCELQMKILKRLGRGGVDFVVIDLPSVIGKDEFLRRIKKISQTSPRSRAQKLNALRTACKIMGLMDEIEAGAHRLAGYEVNPGDCKRILNRCKKEASASKSAEETLSILRDYRNGLGRIVTDRKKKPLRISIIGEIYTVIEPFSNLYIEDKLMDCGVSSERLLTPSWWVKDMMLKPLGLNSIQVNRMAREYLPLGVGGHGRECVGEALVSGEKGMDGAIQIFPLGCMPEIVAKSILPSVQRDRDFPVMTLIVDEMTGEAGFLTRIEAFLDMLGQRKKRTGDF